MDEASRHQRHSRSRSPNRRPKRGRGGFRWKDERSRDYGGRRDNPEEGRGYRTRSPRGERHHDRDSRASRGSRREGGSDSRRDRDGTDQDDENRKNEKKEKPRKKAAAAPPVAAQEMIIVNINDRLGTKTAIPCLPSDTVGQLKLMVAARIGREASQIMLKRQGERPFKDIITLEDYGISHGVQLDLEVDTGD